MVLGWDEYKINDLVKQMRIFVKTLRQRAMESEESQQIKAILSDEIKKLVEAEIIDGVDSG